MGTGNFFGCMPRCISDGAELYGVELDNYIQPSSKKKTCERYSEIIEKHLKVKLGEYELDELTPLALQRYVTELLKGGNIVTGKGLSANSVNGIMRVFWIT